MKGFKTCRISSAVDGTDGDMWGNGSEGGVNVGINPLNAELNPLCYLLALLGAHHFLHVNRIRVKSLTLRQLMFYIYIYIYIHIWSTYS